MNNNAWEDAYGDETTGPSSVVFFPDMSEFEEQDQNEEENNSNEGIASDWALKKIGTLQARLEAIQNAKDSKRFSGSNFYLKFSSSVIFNLANEVFGYNGWSSEIISSHLVHEQLNEENNEYSVKYNVVARIILKDGTYNDELGTGEASNMPHKHMCYNKGKKQAITDGLKNSILGLRDLLLENELKNFERVEKGKP